MHLLADAGMDLSNNPFTTFGALGTMAALGLWFVKREASRADRNEAKLEALHTDIRDTIVPALTQQAQALQQALEVLRDVPRRQP